MPYKQVFAHLYPGFTDISIAERLLFLPDGRLRVQIGSQPEMLETGFAQSVLPSQQVLDGKRLYHQATTPDGRYTLELAFYERNAITEFWLIHTDVATGRVRRAKLNTESETPSQATPRITVSPQGRFFLVDDNGVVRLYSAAHLTGAGVFQVAHANTENQIIALAVSASEKTIIGLSQWKDIVVYDTEQQRVSFVRQISDALGWYDPVPAYVLLVGDTDLILSVGAAQGTLSVNAFQSVSRTALTAQEML